MKPKRDARGRFLPRLAHDPEHRFVILQEDGYPAFRGSFSEALPLAAYANAKMVMTKPDGYVVIRRRGPLRAIL
jgi:hypothetical protein